MLKSCCLLGMNGNACLQGETILQSLVDLSAKLSVRIAVNKPHGSQPVDDLKLLNRSGASFIYMSQQFMSLVVLSFRGLLLMFFPWRSSQVVSDNIY